MISPAAEDSIHINSLILGFNHSQKVNKANTVLFQRDPKLSVSFLGYDRIYSLIFHVFLVVS